MSEATYADFQQRRGRLPDLIEEAIEIYDNFMADDDYDQQRCLDRIIEKLKSARDFYAPLPATHEPASVMREEAAKVERAEAAQLNLYHQAERDRELRRQAEEAFDLIAPFVAKFAAAVGHYNRTPPRYKGSTFNLDPDPGHHPALGVSIHGQVPLNGPTIGDLRLLADAYRSAAAIRNLRLLDGRPNQT